MRDDAALSIENIGDAVLADLDLCHRILDQLEPDLGDAHSRITPPARNRQRHIRLAGQLGPAGGPNWAGEIHRAVVDLVRDRLGELRVP